MLNGLVFVSGPSIPTMGFVDGKRGGILFYFEIRVSA